MAGRRSSWIFLDLDGTLLDSIPALYAAYSDLMISYGRRPDRREFDRLNGPSLPEISRLLTRRHRLPDHAGEVCARYAAFVDRRYAAARPTLSSLGRLTDHLRRSGWGVALVTSAPKLLALKCLERRGWAGYFDRMTFGDEVRRSKPHPEIYLRAVSGARADVRSSVAVEDSASGVRAAERAGLCVIRAMWHRSQPKAGFGIGAPRIKDIGGLDARDVPLMRGDFSVRPLRTLSVRVVRSRKKAVRSGILMVDGYEPCLGSLRILGAFVPYAEHLNNARSRTDTRRRAIAVTAVVLRSTARGEEVLIGRRSARVSTYRNRWELSPAGGLDPGALRPDGRVDVRKALLTELVEETGYRPGDVERMRFFAAADDSRLKTVDLCAWIRIRPRCAGKKPVTDPREHRDMKWMSVDKALRLLGDRKRGVPTCAPILRSYSIRNTNDRGVR